TQNTAPLVTILAPASGTRVLPGSPVAFAGAATDAEDGDLGSRIEWSSSLDGLLGAGAALTTTALRPGVHTITARATDTGGLVGQAAITVTVTHPPVVTIAAPADGTVVFTSGLPMTFTGRATDVEDGDLGARIAWSSDRDGALGPGPGRTVMPSEGSHTLVASATDSDGAVGSAQVHVTITPSPPVVTIAAPPAGTRVFAGTSVAFSGTATDATDGNLTSTLRWTSDRDGAIGLGGSFATTR